MLERFNVVHIPLDAESFADTFLSSVATSTTGRLKTSTTTQGPLFDLGNVDKIEVEPPADFLLGREPTWSDLVDGFAIERTVESELHDRVRDDSLRVLGILGTAGSGKSTILRRLALVAHREGAKIAWMQVETSRTVSQLEAEVRGADLDILVIDRMERFGQRGVDMLRSLTSDSSGPRLIASFSSTAFDDLQVALQLSGISTEWVPIPPLSDDDIHALLDALDRANRLGKLKAQTPTQRFDAFKVRAHRQLLVAMLEATTGERFEDKIASECETLSPDLLLPYAITALATSFRYKLKRDDLLGALNEVTSEGLEAIERLIRQQLILPTAGNTVVLRHPVIAREVISHLRRSAQIGDAIGRLAFVIGTSLYRGMPRTPERRLVTSLSNHQYLRESVASRVQVEQIYNQLESVLADDPHYWLQRGSYELERGNLTSAAVFLSQARALDPYDFMIETEWAYLLLERACREPSSPSAAPDFEEGTRIVFDVIDQRGPQSANTYVILANKTVDWTSHAPLSLDQQKVLLQTVRAAMEAGSPFHGGNRVFVTARKSVEDAYLRLSLPGR